MENKINQADLASELSQAKGISKKEAEKFLDNFFSVIEEYIIREKLVKIKGLGTFKIVDVNERESVNVNTGERIVIAGHSKLSFTPDNALKDAVNRPFADFETVALSDNVSVEEMENTEDVPTVPAEEVQSVDGDTETPMVEPEKPVIAETPVTEPVNAETPFVKPEKPAEQISVEPKAVEPTKPEQKTAELTSAESKAAAKAAAAAAEAAAKAAAAVAEAAAKATPIPVQPVPAPQPAPEPKKGAAHAWIWAAVTVIMLCLSYVAGYYQIIPLSCRNEAQKPVAEVKCKAPERNAAKSKAKPAKKPVAKPVQKPAPKREPTPEELAKNYPQVEGGEYLIIGELDHVHHMQVGETLYKIAGKELGSQKLMQYIMVFNNYPDDVVLHPDEPIKLPKLIKKSN